MPIVEIRMPNEEKEGTEASIAGWLKSLGDRVTEHEPLVEIATDKVTLEVAAPASGTLEKVDKQSGDTVRPGEVLGLIRTQGEEVREEPSSSRGAELPLSDKPAESPSRLAGDASQTYSPAVRKLLAELGLDPQDIPKVSRGGRITPQDIGAYLQAGLREAAPGPLAPQPERVVSPGRIVPHTPMRKSIASHMARSVQTAPHVTSVFEADLSNVLADRIARKQAAGEAVPSVTAYLIHAALQAIRAVPEVNSRWHDAHLEQFDHVNFGVGTALETGGLVVPVIRDAHILDLPAIAKRLRDLTDKARAGKLTQSDMEGGTFTLSNHGVSGSLLAAPIILSHGQAAILGAGKLQKRVIVCENGGRDLFRVRPMMYVTLTIDHRVLDGQQTNAFLTAFVDALEKPARS